MASMLGGNLKAPAKKTPPPSLLVAIKSKPAPKDDAPPDEEEPPPVAPRSPKPPPMAPPDSHEAVEPPSQESGEEYGATLMADMKQPLLDMGMDDDTAKEALAGIFNGMAKCLRGGSKAAMPMMMGDEGEEPAA